MKATDHMRYEQYLDFLRSSGLANSFSDSSVLITSNYNLTSTVRVINDFELQFGFWIWLKVVEQAEQIMRHSEACTDVHQC